MDKGVQCIMSISPLLIPSVDQSAVSEMEGEFSLLLGCIPLLVSHLDI